MYLPKSKYKGNQYTSGDTLVDAETKELYSGPFFETATGEYYTGDKPSRVSRRLEQTEGSTPTLDEPELTIYDLVRKNNDEFTLKSTLLIPRYYPKPSQKDYNTTYFLRYFAIDTVTNQVLEISKEVYTSLKNKEPKYYYPKYRLLILEWNLGSVTENRINTAVAGLDSYLKDPSQFVR